MPGSERPPENWPGWPGGKKFAFVLTHDVENSTGLANCRSLAELEMKFGFRSSFNLVPEGDYDVPADLRNELTSSGFEVGIHDLKHDGHLFASHRVFKERAAQINRYVREWGAVGFRSGFMMSNLDWLHELDVHYDASTFDTDPFEPQPDGGHTIFPFWVPRPTNGNEESSSPGYVELPYTLPQDSTLFLVLRETTPEIWMRKLDWIVQHGGMVLLDTHPDYMAFGRSGLRATYPTRLYLEFLTYVKTRYTGEFWHALPREVASYVRELRASATKTALRRELASVRARSLRGKRAAVVLFSYYPADPRPRRAAEALAREGVLVDVFCLQKNATEAQSESINGVNVFRVRLRRRRGGKLTYFRQYSIFILRSFLYLALRSIRRKYDLVHVHNMPDVLVFSALVPKACGARVILDLHDPMPELMMSIYDLSAETYSVRCLKRLEQLSISCADLVLTPNKAFKEVFASRGCPPAKIQIVMNSPESDIFHVSKASSQVHTSANGDKPFKIMYHGLIAERHGLDTALDAIAKLRSKIPGLEFHIFGDRTSYMSKVEAHVEKLQLQSYVHYHGYRPQNEIAKSIGMIDLGIIPNRQNPFTEINMPTRIFEYLAMGKPVIVPNTRGIRDYLGPDAALFFEPGDSKSLANAISEVYQNPGKVDVILTRGRRVYEAHRWELHRAHFLDRVSALVSPTKLDGTS